MADFDPVSYMMGQKAGPSGGSSTLSGLTDVDISNPSDGQTLVYNATSGKWENGAGGGGGSLVVRWTLDDKLDKTYREIVSTAGTGPVVLLNPDYDPQSGEGSFAYLATAQIEPGGYGLLFFFPDGTSTEHFACANMDDYPELAH